MTEAIHAAQTEALLTIIAALIPLLIWAFRDAEQRFAARRARSRESDRT